MTATALPQLQPLNLGELLDRAIRIYRKNFLAFTGMAALVQTPIVVLEMAASLLTLSSTVTQFQPGTPPPTDVSQLFTPAYFIGIALNLVVSVISFFVVPLMYGAIMRGTTDSYLYQQSAAILSTFGKVFKSAGRLFLTTLLVLLIAVALGIWVIIPCVGWLSGPGLLAYGGWVMYPLIIATCVLEHRGATGSFRRAWDLARRRFWWTMGFAFLITIFGVAVTLGPSVLTGAVLGVVLNADFFVGNPGLALVVRTLVQSVVSLASVVITGPIQIVAYTLMYFDLRVRTEGFDLAVATANASVDSEATVDVVAQAPQPETGRPITAKEIGYFVLVSLILVGLFIVFYGLIIAFVLALVPTLGSF